MSKNRRRWAGAQDGDSQLYISRISREINEIPTLKSLIDNFPEIDYALEYHYANEKKKAEIKALREELYKTGEGPEQDIIVEKLKKFEPKEDAKVVIVIQTLLRLAESSKVGLGYNNSFPYFYNGRYWELILQEKLEDFLGSVAVAGGQNHYYIKTFRRIDRLREQFIKDSQIPTPTVKKNSVLINFTNGTGEIIDGVMNFRQFDPKDFLKYMLPFDYNEGAKTTLFKKFLDQALPEKEAQLVLAEYLGTIFLKHTKIEKCLVLVGRGGTGKSVVYEIVSAMLGAENISSYTLSNLCNESGYYRAQLSNKLLNYSSELGGKGCNPDTVKKLISTEPISARSPYGNAFELKDYCRFMFNTNLIPKDIEQTNAYFRRFMFMEFNVAVPEEKKDLHLANKIIASELGGVFNWVLEGLNRFIAQGYKFTRSRQMEEALNKVKVETNSVAEFVQEEGYQPSSSKYAPGKDLYKQYKFYCDEVGKGRYAVSIQEFYRRLEDLDYHIKRNHTNNATVIFHEQITTNHKKDEVSEMNPFDKLLERK